MTRDIERYQGRKAFDGLVWIDDRLSRLRMHAAFTPVVNAFRFYNDDGDEDGSTPIANENTNITVDVSAGDVRFHLRYLVQETGGVSGATTDDYVPEWSKNSGAYSTAANGVDSALTSFWVSSMATTDRATNGISGGTGSFIAGIADEGPAQILDYQLTASNFTEHVYVFEAVSASVNNGDTFDFRLTLNGGAPGMTNNVTPRVTITKTVTLPPRNLIINHAPTRAAFW